MSRSIDLLKHRYLKNIKENPGLFVGIELEYPVANLEGDATNVEVIKNLFRYLVSTLDFTVEKVDDFGCPIQLVDPKSRDAILFEVSYTTIEFAFGKAETIQEVENRFNNYMDVIQRKLGESNHAIVGCGIHPDWDKNENCPVAYPRYRMLMDYLNLSRNVTKSDLHHFPEYGAFICGSQVQLDVSKSNYLRVINAFTQIEGAKAYLFANSEFTGADWDTKISRDIFWEDSMHGYYQENVGVNPKEFINEKDFLEYLAKTALFYVYRENEILYFEPIRVEDYLAKEKIVAYRLDGTRQEIKPQEEDLKNHRSYHFQDLTTRGTIEYRSVCTQPLNKTFAPIAFHVGLHHNIKELNEYLAQNIVFDFSKESPKQLRRQYSKKNLTESELEKIKQYSLDLLKISRRGLIDRGNNEEEYLEELMKDLGKC